MSAPDIFLSYNREDLVFLADMTKPTGPALVDAFRKA